MKFLVYVCGVWLSAFGAGIAIVQDDILWASVMVVATVGISLLCIWEELK